MLRTRIGTLRFRLFGLRLIAFFCGLQALLRPGSNTLSGSGEEYDFLWSCGYRAQHPQGGLFLAPLWCPRACDRGIDGDKCVRTAANRPESGWSAVRTTPCDPDRRPDRAHRPPSAPVTPKIGSFSASIGASRRRTPLWCGKTADPTPNPRNSCLMQRSRVWSCDAKIFSLHRRFAPRRKR